MLQADRQAGRQEDRKSGRQAGGQAARLTTGGGAHLECGAILQRQHLQRQQALPPLPLQQHQALAQVNPLRRWAASRATAGAQPCHAVGRGSGLNAPALEQWPPVHTSSKQL